MRADKKSHLKADKKPPGRSHKRGVVGYSKKSALLEEAITQMNAGKYGRSSAALKELLALDPSNMEARRLFATLHLRLGSLIPARQAFDALINEAFERQDYWLAESLLREYLAAGPRCVPFLEKLGLLYQEKGDTDEAVAEYGKAIDILLEDPDPDHPELPSQLYAKIRELAPASPVAIRLAPFFDAQTGALIARPAPAVHEADPAESSPEEAQAPISDAVPTPSFTPESAAIPESGAEPPASSIAPLEQAVTAQPDPSLDTPAGAVGLDGASNALETSDAPAPPQAVALDESLASSVLPPAIEPASNEPAPVTEAPALLDSHPSGMLTEPDIQVPEASAEAGVASDGAVPAPMPWEDVQDANIEIPLPPSNEEASSIEVSDAAGAAASSVESATLPSESLPESSPAASEPPSKQEQADISLDLLKKVGFSWESVFDRAWKFGSKAEPAEPSAGTAPAVENVESTTPVEPSSPSAFIDPADSAASPAPTSAAEPAMPWDQIVDSPITIPPPSDQEAPPEPVGPEADTSGSASASTSAGNAGESPIESVSHPMPWDQIQDSVVTIPPPASEEDAVAPVEASEPAPPAIEEERGEQAPSVAVESPALGDTEFRLAPDRPVEVVEPEPRTFETPAAAEPDLGFSLLVEDREAPAPAAPATESSAVEAPPEEPPPVPLPPRAETAATPATEDIIERKSTTESFQTQHDEPAVADAATAPSFTRNDDPLPLSAAPETAERRSTHVQDELLSVDEPAAPSPDSHRETIHASAASVEPAEEAPAALKHARTDLSDGRPARSHRTTDEPRPESRSAPTVAPKEDWIRTGESIKFVEPSAPSIAGRTGERPREEWVRTGESIRFIEPEVPPDEAHLRPPAEVPTDTRSTAAAAAVDVLFSTSGRQTGAVPRPAPAEQPKRRSWLKTRLSRLRIAVTTFVWSCFSTTQAIIRSIVALIVLGCVAAALGVGVVGLTWSIMEQPPSATYQSSTTTPERKLSDSKRNGYLLLLGFEAAGSDPIQAGYERKPDGKDAERAAVCLNDRGSQGGQGHASASVANGWFRDSDPASRFASHGDTIKGWASERENELARYQQWLKLPFEDWGYGQTVVPPCGAILFAHQLYLAQGFALGTETGIDRLEADLEAWRTALAQAKTLPVKIMAVQALQDDIAVASGLLATADMDGKQLPRLTKMLRPLDAGERSIRWPMQNELVTAAKTFEAQLKAERRDDPSFYAAVASLLPLPKQRRLNEYAAYYDAAGKAAEGGQFGALPKRAQHVKYPADSLTAYLTNPIENIVGLEPLPEWDRFYALVTDAEAHLRLASLQAWLRRGPQDADLLGRIAKAGQQFYDPYTGLPMLVNLKKGALYSVGHDGKDQDADPHDDIVAAIPMGQWSTPKPTSASSRGK